MRFFILPIFDGIIMDGYPIFWVVDAGVAGIHHDANIGCPSIMTPSKMDKTKNLIFYSHSYVGLCYFCISLAGFICQKYYYIISWASFE